MHASRVERAKKKKNKNRTRCTEKDKNSTAEPPLVQSNGLYFNSNMMPRRVSALRRMVSQTELEEALPK